MATWRAEYNMRRTNYRRKSSDESSESGEEARIIKEFRRQRQIGPLLDAQCQLNRLHRRDPNPINIQVTPPDGEENDKFAVPMARRRRKLSTPLSVTPDGFYGLRNLRVSPTRSMSTFDRTKRRFSTMVSSAAAAAVSRRLSATLGWLAAPAQVKPHIVRQGRALCLQYIKTQIRRSTLCAKKQIVLKRLQRLVETECPEEAMNNTEYGVLAGLRALCATLERKRPETFKNVARQATRAPSAMLKSETAVAELTLALGRRITRDRITWAKIAAVYSICGSLAREAAEAADGEPSIELVTAPAAAIADLLHEQAGSWVSSHGGWTGLVDRLRASERDHRSETNLKVIVTVFVFACITLLLFRWVLHAHPGYNSE